MLSPKILILIQARTNSSRFPNKVMQIVGGKPMVKRVWDAAKQFAYGMGTANVIVKVAWPERYPDLDESNVLERFRLLAIEYSPDYIIRLTADCPLLSSGDIHRAWFDFITKTISYYNNRIDGRDVQVFTTGFLFRPEPVTHREHVINDTPNTGGLSVNTPADLEKVRSLVR